ncbi:tetratricopeptide repeat protein [Gimesia algae]|uniref:Cellulose synthase subunit BcsC n=1 Tax=Gimesia algae TaxID=2527971 RepID=A0A517VNG1_9PLAN|nr:tetratricopeptide repeat protein [Gimesia algae]QDT94561.1 cellulose synthase subunit BcsC [Gimesia algae]
MKRLHGRPARYLRMMFCAAGLVCCGCQTVPVTSLAFLPEVGSIQKTTEPHYEEPADSLPASPYNQQANKLVQQALEHYSNGELKRAKVLLASARDIDPGHSGTFEIEAQLSYDMGDRNQFLQSLRAIRAASPHDSDKQSAIGTLFFQAGQTQEGIACLKRAIELKPYDENYALKLAAFYEQAGRTDEAQQVLLKALHTTPGSRRLPIALGRICEASQQWSQASVYYAMVVNHFPENHVWRKQRARCLYYSGNFTAAFEEFSTCQKNDPESLSLAEMIAFGDAALQIGNLEQAQLLFDDISVKHQRELLHVEILRGLCAINRGQSTSAKNIIATARKKWPTDETLLEVAALIPPEQFTVR